MTIGNGVTSIGSYAFSGCYKLMEVINKSSLSITKGSSNYGYIGSYALCVHNGESKIVNVNDYLFMPYEGTNYLLGYVGSDTELVLPDSYNGQNYSIYKYSFYSCSSLMSIIIPDSVASIASGAFYGCSSLKNITIPFVGGSMKTSSDIYQYPFGYIFGTSSYTGGVATTQYYYGSSTSSTTYTTYYIPSSLKSVTVTGGEILYGAFYNCSGLTSINIGGSVTSIRNGAFAGCSSLQYYEYDNAYYLGNKDNRYFALIRSKGSSISSCSIHNDSKLIADYAFAHHQKLTSITFGNFVTSIGNFAFASCYSLKSVIIPDSVTSIGDDAFSHCDDLKRVTIGSGIISIGIFPFYGSGLASIYYTGTASQWAMIDGLYYIMNDMGNRTLYIDGETPKEIELNCPEIKPYAFFHCKSLTKVRLSDDVTSIGEHAFRYCSGLTSVTIPDSVTSIGDDAFSFCDGLTNITIPDSVTSIGIDAFSYCNGLTSVTIGDGVLSIERFAFICCRGLTSVTIGNGVKSIGGGAFDYCSGLTSVYYTGTTDDWTKIEIGSNNSALTSATRYYYSETEPTLNGDGTAYDGNYWHYAPDGTTPVIWVKEN